MIATQDQDAVKKKYNFCLDFIKGIACFLVVCMHCEFPGNFGIAVQTVSRFCVPFFFMVSGYYCYYEKNAETKSVSTKLIPIFKLTMVAVVLNIVYLIISFERPAVSFKDVLIFLLFNQPVVIISSYWFLFALIYVYLLYALIKKFNLYKIAYKLIPCFFVCYIVFAQGMHLAGYNMPNYIYRNFLIEGLPFFMLGNYLHYKQDEIKIKNSILLVIAFVFTALCLIERYLLGRDFGVNICTIPQVITLFLFGIKNPSVGMGCVQRIGKKYSMYIYIFHPITWRVLGKMYLVLLLNENMTALYLMPVATFLMSLLFAVWYVAAIGFIRKPKVV